MKTIQSRAAIFISILFASIVTCNAMELIELSGDNIFVPEKLGGIKVFHNDKGFQIREDEEFHDVQNCFVDKEIRNLSNEQLAYFLGIMKDVEIDGQLHKLIKVPAESTIDNNEVILNELNNKEASKFAALLATTAYLSIGKISDEEYSIHAKTRLPGGGVGGATAGFWIVRAGISVLGHGTLAVISAFAGPVAGPGVFVGLETTFGPVIESAANVGGLAAGMAAGVVTGPV